MAKVKMQSWFPGKQCGSSQFFLKFTRLQRISVLNERNSLSLFQVGLFKSVVFLISYYL